MIILLISTLKVVLFSRKLSNFHWLFSFPVTDFLYRNDYSFVPLLFVIWSLCHSNIFINMTVIIPPMTKHARLCQNCLPKYIVFSFTRCCSRTSSSFGQKWRTRRVAGSCSCGARFLLLGHLEDYKRKGKRVKFLLKNIFVSAERGGQKWNKRIKVAFTWSGIPVYWKKKKQRTFEARKCAL